MKKYILQIALIISVLTLVALAVVGTVYFRARSSAVVKERSVYVPTEATYKQLIDSLGEDGKYIKNIQHFLNTAELVNLDDNVRPGHYMLEKGMSYMTAVKMFQRGLQTPVRVTFNNVRNLEQLADRVASQIEPDSLSLIQTFLNDTIPTHYGFSEEEFIAMFVPNTYEVYWTITPIGFLDRMKREYDSFWSGERDNKRKEIGLTREEVMTLASIVYEETKMSDEMPIVAGVYINRLNIKMPLQADPTVKFALGDFSIKRVLNKHLEVESPYNTYRNAGLPPGPISMPSVSAIDGVLNYKEHKYLYFCAKPDFSGYHNFAATLAEHNRNARSWSAALNNAGIR